MRRRPRTALASLAVLLLLPAIRGALPLPVRVEVDPAWTSIYVGVVTLRTTEFNRGTDGAFHATYTARVIPYFPANEAGVISIAVSDADLARLLTGETIDFTGSARNGQGEARAVSGRATPVDVRQGGLKVRVRVSPRIELIFNTTYRFATAAPEGLNPTGR
ncbi:MAG: hypothetical protein FJ381_08485 [Verrucomicrobia bacterium]|nr:hypothetical protein [Verrucomicrobiota bacterium]